MKRRHSYHILPILLVSLLATGCETTGGGGGGEGAPPPVELPPDDTPPADGGTVGTNVSGSPQQGTEISSADMAGAEAFDRIVRKEDLPVGLKAMLGEFETQGVGTAGHPFTTSTSIIDNRPDSHALGRSVTAIE